MFKKILVGTDGSDTAAQAVAHAAALAKIAGAELAVVHAYPAPKADGGPFGGDSPPYVDIGRGVLRDVEKRYPGTRTLLLEGDPAESIIDAAEAEGCDLIVVGNVGMTGAKRFLLGSVPNRVSHHAPCSVLIAHTTSGAAMPKEEGLYASTLIATDGSPTAGEAARVGAALCRAVGAKAIVLHVGDRSTGEKVVEQAARSLGDGLDVATRTEEGDPADRILDVAERDGCDLIVVGNKGMAGAGRFLLGSVPNRVSHHSPCNVLIVKTT